MAVPRLDGLVVLSQNGSEPNVGQLGECLVLGREPFACGQEKLLEMIPLAPVRNVDHLLRRPLLRLALRDGLELFEHGDRQGILGVGIVMILVVNKEIYVVNVGVMVLMKAHVIVMVM